MVYPANAFDGPVVYLANAFDSRLRGEQVLRGSRQNLKKRLFGLTARNRPSLSLRLSFSPSSYFLSFSIQKSEFFIFAPGLSYDLSKFSDDSIRKVLYGKVQFFAYENVFFTVPSGGITYPIIAHCPSGLGAPQTIIRCMCVCVIVVTIKR